jgi:phage FluMu protein Com
MQKIRCKQCGKLLLEAEGQATIIKDCPKCKTRNFIEIGQKEMEIIKK